MGTFKRHAGYTLIELMIVVAVIGILGGIAYPSYKENVMKGRRADAKAGLMSLQLAQEKYRTNCTQYATGIDTAMSCGGGSFNLIGSKDSPDKNYTLSIVSTTTSVLSSSGATTVDSPTGTTYALRATRTGLQNGDKCGDYVIDQNGDKYLVSATYASGYDVSSCW